MIPKNIPKLLKYSILSLVAGSFIAYFGHGNPLLLIMILLFIFWICLIPALIVFLICKVIGRKKKTERIVELTSKFKIIAVVTIILSLTISAGFSFWSGDVEKAQAFCIELALDLEKKREKTGTYPSEITAFLKERSEIPHYIDERRLYKKINGGYELSFVVTGGLFPRRYKYNSKTRDWKIHR